MGLAAAASIQSEPVRAPTAKPDPEAGAEQVRIPSRASSPLFSDRQGKQKTELNYDPDTHTVKLKLLVQDPNGYFVPNLRPENFVVYEDGVPERNAKVEIEHAPASIGLLLESGGHSPVMNRVVVQETANAARQFIEILGRDDTFAVYRYSDKTRQVADFSSPRDSLDPLFFNYATPEISEANLYDAVISTIEAMSRMKGRKAILLISSGIDTFSKASFEDALKAAGNCESPIYGLSLAPALRPNLDFTVRPNPLAAIDWKKPQRELQRISLVSGGRAYFPESATDLATYYDDILENLKVRYVISYRSSNNSDPNIPRTVRVELVDPRTGKPVRIVDATGSIIRANVIAQHSYVPGATSTK
jgi:Ca-activated chloride channel family protein